MQFAEQVSLETDTHKQVDLSLAGNKSSAPIVYYIYSYGYNYPMVTWIPSDYCTTRDLGVVPFVNCVY